MVTVFPTTPQHWQLKSTNAAVQNKVIKLSGIR